MNERDAVSNVTEIEKTPDKNAAKGHSRRKFLGQVGAALTGSALLGNTVLASGESNITRVGDGIRAPGPRSDPRVRRCFAIRLGTANDEAHIPVPPHTTNGDEDRYPDKCGTYSKGILQDGIGLVNLNAFQSFKRALTSGNPADFENIIMGGTRTLNGPQSGLAFGLEGSDAIQFGNAPCPDRAGCPAGLDVDPDRRPARQGREDRLEDEVRGGEAERGLIPLLATRPPEVGRDRAPRATSASTGSASPSRRRRDRS